MDSTPSSPSEYHSAASIGDWHPRPRRYVSSPALPVARTATPLRLRSPSQSTFGPPFVLRMDHHHPHQHHNNSTSNNTPARKLQQSTNAAPTDVSPDSYSSPNNTVSSQSYLTLSSRGSPPRADDHGRRLYGPRDWQYQVAERLFLEGALNESTAFVHPSDHSLSASQDDDPFRSDVSPDSSHHPSSQPMHHNPSKTSLGARLRSSLPLSRSRSFSRSKSTHPGASSNSLSSSSPPSLPLPPLPSITSPNPPLSPFSSAHPLPLKRKQDDLNSYPPLLPPPLSPNALNSPLPPDLSIRSLPRDSADNHLHNNTFNQSGYDDDDGPVVRGRAIPSEQSAVVYSLNNSSRLSRFSLSPSLTPSETANLAKAPKNWEDDENRHSNSNNKKGLPLTSIQEASSSGSISTTTSERFQDSPDDDFTDHSRIVMTGPRSVKTSLVFSPCDDPNFYAVPPAKLRKVWKHRRSRPATWSPNHYNDEDDAGQDGDGEDEDTTDVDTTHNYGDSLLQDVSSRFQDASGLNTTGASTFVSRNSKRHRKVQSSPVETLNNNSSNNRNRSKYHRKATTITERETYLQSSPSQTFLPAVMRGPRVVYFERRRYDDDGSGSASQHSRAADSNHNNGAPNDTVRGRSVWSLTSSDNRQSESSRHVRRRSLHHNNQRRRSVHEVGATSASDSGTSGPGSSSEASSFGFLSKSTLLCLPSSFVGPLSLVPFGAWCFACGFIFFPLWWLGSVYPSTQNHTAIHMSPPPRRSFIRSMFGSTYGSLTRSDEGIIGISRDKHDSNVEKDAAGENENSAEGWEPNEGYGTRRPTVSWPVALDLPTTPTSKKSPNDLPLPKPFSDWLTDDPATRKTPPSPHQPMHTQHEYIVPDNANYHPSKHNSQRAVHTWKIRCRFMSVFSVFILVPILVLVVVTGTKSARQSQVHD